MEARWRRFFLLHKTLERHEKQSAVIKLSPSSAQTVQRKIYIFQTKCCIPDNSLQQTRTPINFGTKLSQGMMNNLESSFFAQQCPRRFEEARQALRSNAAARTRRTSSTLAPSFLAQNSSKASVISCSHRCFAQQRT